VTTQLGYDPDELLGKGPEFWQGPDFDLADIREVDIALRNGGTVVFERDAVRKDGTSVAVHVELVPYETESSFYVVAFSREVGPRRERRRGPVLTVGDLSLDLVRGEAQRGGRPLHLTATELRLLEVFLRHPGRLLSRDFLLEEVWGYEPRTRSRSVEVYVGYLRRKMEAGADERLIHTVRGRGYVLRHG